MNSDFKDLLQCLNECRCRYLVIGGHAVAYYTEPRYTKDIDIWVEASPSNSRKIFAALNNFGAPLDNVDVKDFAKPGTLLIFGLPPNRVDILNRVKGATFATAWKRRKQVSFEGVNINFVSKADLIKLKAAAGRPQDKLDLLALGKSR